MGYVKPDYYREPRWVDEGFVEKIEQYGDKRYTVMHNWLTGYDVIMHARAVVWEDEKNVEHGHWEYMPELALVHPKPPHLSWRYPPIDYWMRQLWITDTANRPAKDVFRSIKEQEEKRDKDVHKDDTYRDKGAADMVRSFDRTTITAPGPLGQQDGE